MRLIVPAIMLLLVTCAAPLCLAGDESAGGSDISYQSPYSVVLPWSEQELIPDLLEEKRGNPRFEAKIPQSEWYGHLDPRVGPWGPLPRAYPPPALAQLKGDDWKRARIIATALRFLGYHYRHHYIPDWDPPPGWYIPKPGGTRHDGKGVDCSNFTSFVYNQGLGIGISSDIHKQAATEFATIHGTDQPYPVLVIPHQDSASTWADVLKPGDLLFIRPRNGDFISHVVIWIGAWGAPAGGPPLILDSHGAEVRDSTGTLIPEGVYVRPFRPNSWYAVDADHAIRIIGQ
jgi:cell wall-associated NlpC family hydrolase